MRFNITLKNYGITLLCLLLTVILKGQTYSFKNYGAESDIPNGFVYTINQSDNGFLWVSTGSGLTRFDGFEFFNVGYPDSVAGRYSNVSLKDKNGTLWFGSNDGSVFYAPGNDLTRVNLPNTKSISEIIVGPGDLIYIIPQGNSVFTINPSDPDEIGEYTIPDNPVIFSASFTDSGNLLVGTQEKILVCKLGNDSLSVIDVIEGFNYSAVTSIHQTPDRSGFVIGTDGDGLFQLKLTEDGHSLSRFRGHPEWEYLSVQSITEDSDNFIWVSTYGSGAFQIRLSDTSGDVISVLEYNRSTGLSRDDVKTVFQDVEGNYWFGLYGEGISMLTSFSFAYYTPGDNSPENNIIYVNSFDNKYLLGTPSGFHLFDPVTGKSTSFTNLTRQVGNVDITSYFLDSNKTLWIGSGGNGLFVKDGPGSVKLFHRTGDSGADYIKDIEIDDTYIWLATTNGVLVLDRRTHTLRRKFDISNGLPHNSINKILLSQNGRAYIGTESERLYMIDRDFNIISGKASMSGSTINKILSISQGRNGVIWAATQGNGIFEFNNDTVSSISRSQDLMNNYCYSILADSENNIWIGHAKGFSRFDPENRTMSVFGADFVKSGVCNTEGMFESSDNKILIGTTEGLIIYDKQKDRKRDIAPFNNINFITINDVRYPYRPSFILPYKKYAVRISFSGIHFRAPDKVYYSTYLENFDSDWSKMFNSREVTYSLSDGKYRFSLLSVDEEAESQGNMVSFDIIIKRPFWRTWWFIIIFMGTISGTVILIIRERDKAQKKIQAYLESELDARTAVVRKQKAEIELQNLEITDSINYAKRIQSSILPDVGKLKETFKDAFVLFYPRDIVSGDFYWFDKLDDGKFVLVCADSTGHGVPGAFMSMIGSTLLQDIVTRKRITKPSEILTLLDRQIFSTLNQNVELGVSNDGMDMVICEFEIATRHIRFASAMRPVIIVIEGEPYYIKGNRSSVGGESVIEKYFDDQEYYLNDGDTVYLFSDGLPDQFGGPDGKKLKIARLKRIIEKISKLPMDEQKDILSKSYFDWRGSFDQVDDILMIGVRI